MTGQFDIPPVEEQRALLRDTELVAERTYRVLFVGQFANGPTDVVACLLRALDNLGHTVFHWDPLRHQETLHNPSGAAGGHGPLFVRLAPMRAALDVFRPQVVVLCANGMVLDDAAAEELRERGVVTIGVTLSDPDVLPSVVDHVGRFDYHTTNSLQALQRYREAGHLGTLLLPFGIDRDYVLQRVPADPSVRTLVACIGHAVGRRDRHELMTRLAGEFAVRVYGSGWPIPGAAPVQGVRLLQAAREATFHVNFPATLAGHTNVKCGVFESVGAGAILCTSVFDEMRRFFTYDEEIVGYSDADDLAAAIRGLVADPARLEQIRRRSFHRLTTGHLYEHRWTDLFADIDADLASAAPAVGTARAAEIRQVLDVAAPRPRVVVLSGYYGAGNLGDDLLLDSIGGAIEAQVPDAIVAVACSHPAAVERDQGRPAFDRSSPAAADTWAARSSAVVLGGGGLWHDYSIDVAGGISGLLTGASVSPAHLTQLPLLASVHQAPFHVFGMGVGPLADPDARRLVRFAGSLAQSVVVRDRASAGLLAGLHDWCGKVEVAPDAVYALPLPSSRVPAALRGPVPGRYVALNVRPWPAAATEVRQVVLRAVEVAGQHGLGVVGVPMSRPDEALLEELLRDVELPGGVQVLAADSSVAARLATLGAAEAVVAMRLHAALLAHRLGRVVVGAAYDPKVVHHFAELGRHDWVVALDEGHQIRELVSAALAAGELPPGTREIVARLEAEATRALTDLATRVRSARVRRPPVGRIAAAPPTTGSPHTPAGWTPEEVVTLSSLEPFGVSTTDAGRQVPMRSGRVGGSPPGGGAVGVRFAGVPLRGDAVGLRLAVPTVAGKGSRLELWVTEQHREAVVARGRMAYEVVLDGTVVLREDVARWHQRNTVWVAWQASGESAVVEARLVALCDLHDHADWAQSRALRVEAVRLQPWKVQRPVAVSASSPFASVVARPGRPPGSRPARDGRSRLRPLAHALRSLRP